MASLDLFISNPFPPPNCVALTRYFYPPSERSDADLVAQLEQGHELLRRNITCALQQNQWDALLCLASDVVAGLAASSSSTFERSFLVTALNRGMLQIAAAEFHSFCYADGKVQTRVWEKRKAEQYLFSQGRLLFPLDKCSP